MARISLSRTGNQRYQNGYLRSQAWGWRRQRWFRDCRQAGLEPACQVCEILMTDYRQLTGKDLDLHHVSYDGVIYDEGSGKWIAKEADEDLMPMCRVCHNDLHRVMDRPKDHTGWDRSNATVNIIVHLRRQLAENPGHQQLQDPTHVEPKPLTDRKAHRSD